MHQCHRYQAMDALHASCGTSHQHSGVGEMEPYVGQGTLGFQLKNLMCDRRRHKCALCFHSFSLRFIPSLYIYIFLKETILSLLNQFYFIAFISSNYYMYEATSYAGSYVQAGRGTHSPWYMKSIGLSEALGMLLGPQRLQGWANGSENQGQEHTASGSSEPFPSRQ